MIRLLFFSTLLPFYSQSQSVDVIVWGTTIEISGGTYDIVSSSSQEILLLDMENNSGIDHEWRLERILPSTQFWNDPSLSWGLLSNPLAGDDFIIGTSPSWITPQSISIPDGDVIHVILRYDAQSPGCDLYSYYILNDNVRVDSFNVNICKSVGLDEVTSDNLFVYPNPSNSELNINFHGNIPNEIILFDLLGNKIATFDASKDMDISTKELSDGVYFLSWEIDGIIQKKKFQVQH